MQLLTLHELGTFGRPSISNLMWRTLSAWSRLAVPLLAAVMSLAALDANAALRYVRQGATGAQDGSDWTNAYSSLPSALVRGDTYFVADGAYAGLTFSTAANGTIPITIKKATRADHGTSSGWVDSYGDGQVSFSGGFSFTSPYWILDGQTGGGAINAWSQGFGFKVTETGDDTAVIKVAGTANNVTIQHVDLQGKGSVSVSGGSASNDGLAVYGASNVTLSYFRMQGIGRCPFFVSPRNLVVEHGWVQSFYGSSAVHSEVASIWAFAGSIGDVTFRYNLFTDIQSTGGLMWDNSSNASAGMAVYGNVFYKPAGANWDRANGVIGGWTGGNGEQFRNVLVYNNSFVNVDQESLSTFPNVYSGNVAYNNLFYNSASPSFSKFGNHNNNHFINSGGAQSEPNGTSAASGDPFVNMAALDFRLKAATSPGVTLLAPFNADPYGKVRGSDGTAERGAFEFTSGGAAIVSLAPPNNLSVR